MEILITAIKIGERKRKVVTEKVSILAESIKKIGLLHPIALNKDLQLISGLHRIEAFKLLEREFIPCNIFSLDTLNAELVEIDENLLRIELNVLERSEQLERRKTIYELINPDSKQYSSRRQTLIRQRGEINSLGEKTFTEDTANKTGLSQRTIQQEIQIAKNISPEIKDVIRDMEIADNKTELLQLARIVEPEKQKAIVNHLITGTAKNVIQAIQNINRENKVKIPLPDNLYDVIYADPPWKYEIGTISNNRAIENQYPTMDLEEIKAVPVPSGENSILFLWATAPKLEEALEVMKAWGFKYRTCSIWDKIFLGMGYWFRIQHEILLVGIKGKFFAPEPKHRFRSVYHEKRGKHSKKPDYYYDIIEKMFPNTKKLELFSRKLRDGWTSWGNEISN